MTTSNQSSIETIQRLHDQIRSVIRGKDKEIELLIIALLANGSVLLRDVPGVGKTTLAKTLAASVDLEFQRVQCTPDLLPADIFGFSVFNPQDGSFQFRPGPIFCNVLLLDEINRASPRTQSALLEGMAEKQVTIEGERHVLPAPFIVLATQNPAGFQGTFPLPESQLDRFLFQISLDYPDLDSEVAILFDQNSEHPIESVTPILDRQDLLHLQEQVRRVTFTKPVAEYLVRLVQQTRDSQRFELGCSPRGTLMLYRAAQAHAFIAGRDFVRPDDVQRVAPLVLQHRVVVRQAHMKSHPVWLDEIIESIEVPVV